MENISNKLVFTFDKKKRAFIFSTEKQRFQTCTLGVYIYYVHVMPLEIIIIIITRTRIKNEIVALNTYCRLKPRCRRFSLFPVPVL